MPQTYSKTHTNKKALDNHVRKIKNNGGVITKNENGKIEYHFPKSVINKKYTHFAVLKSSGKIVNGWEYKDYDSEELNSEKKHYFYNDLEDMDIDKKDVTIITKSKLVKKGVNPFDTDNWGK